MSTINAEIKGWFATPIVVAKLPDSENLNRALTALFLEKEKAGDQYRNPVRIPTQVGNLFESTCDLFGWPDPPVQSLARECHTVLRDLVANLNGYDAAEVAKLTFQYESWFHITRTGGYQTLHYHPVASWSGIYCVHPGEKLPHRPQSGVVKFHDPRGAAFMHMDAGNGGLDSRFGSIPVYVNHEPGQLVVFPSYLMHEVLPYEGTGERIVVPFNARVNKSN